MLDHAPYVLVVGVVRVDEGRLLRGVVIVLVLVFLGLSDLVGQLGLGGGLAAAGDVRTVKDSENIFISVNKKYLNVSKIIRAWQSRGFVVCVLTIDEVSDNYLV